MPSGRTTIGIIANPASARDIRRVVAGAGSLQIADRVNIIMRMIATAVSLGVERVLVMPDRGGICAMIARQLNSSPQALEPRLPVEFLDMQPTSTVRDTFQAARMMCEAGVSAIAVLGGDGTHRAVVRELMGTERIVPIIALSTGTNNAFPELRESTIAGIAAALYATARVDADQALVPNKLLEVCVNQGQRRDVALVDVVVSVDGHTGARAIWSTEQIKSLYLSFADPEVIGLSSIGGLLHPVGRREPGGLALWMNAAPGRPAVSLRAPIVPGRLCEVAVSRFEAMPAGRPYLVAQRGGMIALDGEREFAFEEGDRVEVTLREDAFYTVDVAKSLAYAARQGLLLSAKTSD